MTQPTDNATIETVAAGDAPDNIKAAAPRRGRRPLGEPPADMAQLRAEGDAAAAAAAPAIAELRANAVTMPRAELAQSLHLAKVAGSIAAFQFNEAVNRVAALKAFAEIRDSKAYKGLSVHTVTGDVVTVNTWEEFCNAHGYSYQKIAEDLKNLATFGDSLLEMQEALGLGYRDLRLLRQGIAQLPPEERKAILDEMQSAEGPEELKSRLAELRTELAEVKAGKKALEADIQAKERLSKAKSERLDNLEEQINRLTSMAPDDRQRALADINAKARADLDAACTRFWATTIDLCSQCATMLSDERSADDTCAYVHERVSLLMGNVSDAIMQTGVSVDLRQYLELPGEDAALESPERR